MEVAGISEIQTNLLGTNIWLGVPVDNKHPLMWSDRHTEQVAWECRGGSPNLSLTSQSWDHSPWVLKKE